MISIKGTGGGTSKFPTSISVATPPTRTSYICGEMLDLTGIVVTATFSDNSTMVITSECTFSPASDSALTEDNTSIAIEWSWKGIITYNTMQPITVQRVLSSIAISKLPTKTAYNKNEKLDLSGMVVMATFTSGKTADITGYISSPADGSTLSSLGNETVTITYKENEVSKQATLSVSVSVKIVTWANGTDQEIADMIAAADAGLLTLSDYWVVGNERTVHLSAMAATGVGESHVAQDVTMVILSAGGKTLASGGTCNFIVGLKNGLNENGYMNSGDTNSGGWHNCARRTWCNSVFYNALPETFKSIFKQFKNITANGNGSSTTESTDYFALPAEKEIFGSNTYGNSAAETSLIQFDYYKISANRIKRYGDSGSALGWWERSPYSGSSLFFCLVSSGGSTIYDYASCSCLVAPFGCI